MEKYGVDQASFDKEDLEKTAEEKNPAVKYLDELNAMTKVASIAPKPKPEEETGEQKPD